VSLYVVDASVAVKWYVPEVHSDHAARLLAGGDDLHAPDLLHAEFGNILWKKTRQGQLSATEARRIWRALLAGPLRIHSSATLLEGASDLAIRSGRTVYDSLYLALALALGGTLVTADVRMLRGLAAMPVRRHVVWVGDLG
jgi:predicted nucleic acid-binding protein